MPRPTAATVTPLCVFLIVACASTIRTHSRVVAAPPDQALPMMVAAAALPAFRRDDHIIILVSGNALQSAPFGYSGAGSMYQASGSSAFSRYTFSVVSGASDVPLERRSAKDITNRGDYGTNAYIPPGVYFLHYHKFDTSHNLQRRRLGLGDNKCSEDIAARPNGAPVTRQFIQFHVAYNNLNEFSPGVSQGCLTLTQAQFDILFPTGFFGTGSPLADCPQDGDDDQMSGNGDILVFVTDASNDALQTRQLTLFKAIVRGDSGGLSSAHFAPGSELALLRSRWYTGIP
jgi:hypothetical protein